MKPQVIASFGEEIYLATCRASRMNQVERHGRSVDMGPKIHNPKSYSRKPKHRNLNPYEYDY